MHELSNTFCDIIIITILLHKIIIHLPTSSTKMSRDKKIIFYDISINETLFSQAQLIFDLESNRDNEF